MNYDVHFSFTTVKGSRFTGRNGVLNVNTDAVPDNMIKDEELKRLIASFIHSKKPTYNIFLINIDEIKQLNT